MMIITTIENAKFLDKKEHKKGGEKKIGEKEETAVARIMKVAEKLNLFRIHTYIYTHTHIYIYI